MAASVLGGNKSQEIRRNPSGRQKILGFPISNPLPGAADGKVPRRGLGWSEKLRTPRETYFLSLPRSVWSHRVSGAGGEVLRSPLIGPCPLHSIGLHAFIEHLLCATPWARCWEHSSEQDRQKSLPLQN